MALTVLCYYNLFLDFPIFGIMIVEHVFFRVFFVFVLAFLGLLYPYNRGALSSYLVVAYALTSVVAGYSAASFHAQLAGRRWVRVTCTYHNVITLLFNIINASKNK